MTGGSMYAVIKTGGRQYNVEPGEIIEVEALDGAVGEQIVLDEVLLFSNGDEVKIGQPNIEGSKVVCEVVWQGKSKKIIAFKFRRRKGSKSKKGHRQLLTRLR